MLGRRHVDPSVSVKGKMTGPVGSPGIGGLRSCAKASPAEGDVRRSLCRLLGYETSVRTEVGPNSPRGS